MDISCVRRSGAWAAVDGRFSLTAALPVPVCPLLLLSFLLQEAAMMTRMRHPNIVQASSQGWLPESLPGVVSLPPVLTSPRSTTLCLPLQFMGLCTLPPALITEYCQRGSLYDVMQAAKRDPSVAAQLTWRRRLGMAIDAGTGLLYLHSRNILHRDGAASGGGLLSMLMRCWLPAVGHPPHAPLLTRPSLPLVRFLCACSQVAQPAGGCTLGGQGKGKRELWAQPSRSESCQPPHLIARPRFLYSVSAGLRLQPVKDPGGCSGGPAGLQHGWRFQPHLACERQFGRRGAMPVQAPLCHWNPAIRPCRRLPFRRRLRSCGATAPAPRATLSALASCCLNSSPGRWSVKQLTSNRSACGLSCRCPAAVHTTHSSPHAHPPASAAMPLPPLCSPGWAAACRPSRSATPW